MNRSWPRMPLILGLAQLAMASLAAGIEDRKLELDFATPPREARLQVFWWWLNSNVSEPGVSFELAEMARKGIGSALVFDASSWDAYTPVEKLAPFGPPFMSEPWRRVFRHALAEAQRLGITIDVNMTNGFNAGGPWITPEFNTQEIVWGETLIKGPRAFDETLALPAGPILDAKGQPLQLQDFLVNNEVPRDARGEPVYYRDVAVVAVPADANALQPARDTEIAEPGRLKHWALKSVHTLDFPFDSNGFRFDVVYDEAPDQPGEPRVPLDDVIDLTDRLQPDGRLRWDVPDGEWVVMRFGHACTSMTLVATHPKLGGLAMDHLSAAAADRHFNATGRPLLEDIGGHAGRTARHFHFDSWELRLANWTAGFEREFERRRGYDMTRYLPVLAGRIVENREISNRFLHDYRMTIGDLFADNYYRKFRELARAGGMALQAEMFTDPLPVDMLKCLGRADVPIGEYWAPSRSGRTEPWMRFFGKQAASAAHIYGLPYAAVEAFTAVGPHWEQGPWELKSTADGAFCAGVNRLIHHEWTYSPPEAGWPGFEYFADTHMNPRVTWWEQAGAWSDYLARCQATLQSGHFVADVAYYQGDRVPSFVPDRNIKPLRGLGSGYDYDYLNTEVLLERLTVRDGRLVLPDGMSYSLLALPGHAAMPLEVIRKLRELVAAGAAIVGPKPERALGLKDYPHCDAEVQELADELWGKADGEITGQRTYGKGSVIWGLTLDEALAGKGLLPDFEIADQQATATLNFIHRRITEAGGEVDLYFVVNATDRWVAADGWFRVGGKAPELWHPDTGRVEPCASYREDGGRTCLPLSLAPRGSVFVVFRRPAKEPPVVAMTRAGRAIFPRNAIDFAEPAELLRQKADGGIQLLAASGSEYELQWMNGATKSITLDAPPAAVALEGTWDVEFPAGGGAPLHETFQRLASWTEFDPPGIKYFSGTATYRKSFELPEALAGDDLELSIDLGQVKNIAEVSLNGRELATLWKPPFRVRISGVARPGENQLEVRVTNYWPNRLIGDQRANEHERVAFTNISKFKGDMPLMESGLLGPVQLRAMRVIDVGVAEGN